MPSERILAIKKAQCEALTEKLKTAVSGVLVSYEGITVEQDTQLRSQMRKAGVEYKVYKNTMTERAFDAAGMGELKPHLVGMNALAISQEDPVAPAKILKEYADKIPTFEIKAGFVEGKLLDQNGVIELAQIPSKETLICKVMLSMQSPLYKLAYALQAIIDKSGEAPEEAAAEPAAE
ncbi:MAG: 50S ribosomal protein L10 [Clostridiales bacterium]|jgi:large subunit ribosomal protein L10|nr:50S ribosomal protein L10 [Clostridiales bacterium]